MFSSAIQSWETPKQLFDKLNDEFHFTLDPCADDINHKCDKYYTIKDDGLNKDWVGETVFINPEYKYSKEWINKAYKEWRNNHVTSVLLIPARVDVRIWGDVISVFAAQIRFIKGRLKFSGHSNSAPFPSALVIFSNHHYNERVIWIDQ
jgi:site-specific DNA-methyltransferase (adenine-specific)